MGLFDLINFAVDKAYGKFKDSKLESVMDAILNSLDSTAINVEMLPYNEGEDKRKIRGMVYRLTKEEVLGSSATYFLTTSDWLSKVGISISNDKTYEAALHEKSGYLYNNLFEVYKNAYNNYKVKYNSKPALMALFLYVPEDKIMMSIPRFFKDKKTEKTLLAKRADIYEFNKLDSIRPDNPDKSEVILSNFYFRAKLFAYKVAEELKANDMDDLENAFRKFQEKHAPHGEVEYTF
ncbi:MAG: hypothetical protein M1402_04910 [Candidatus Thermoplasmatota archaeon]|nr:hypothetical protein [Candidatus Thermoplasmatota archaeon]